MNRLKLLRLLLSILLLSLLPSCTPKPPDVPVCENLSQVITKDLDSDHLIIHASPACKKNISELECGHCTYVISGKEIYVGNLREHYFNRKSWNEIKAESILVPAEESYAPISTYIINSCKKMNCEESVDRFKVKLDALVNKK